MTASLRERAEVAAKEILEMLKDNHPEAHTPEVSHAIEVAITKALLEERSRCANLAAQHCGAEPDKAHQLREEINRINTALIANLEGMR